jgi:hypothetical protein
MSEAAYQVAIGFLVLICIWFAAAGNNVARKANEALREARQRENALLAQLHPGLDLTPPEERPAVKPPVYLGPLEGWDYETKETVSG